MANHASHAALPYPIKGARFTIFIPYLAGTGVPTDPTTPDTEISKDDAAAGDTAEEVSSPKNSIGMLTLTGDETNCSAIGLAAKAASGPNTSLGTIYPRPLASVGTGTLSAGSAGGGTLGTLLPYDITGCFIKTTGGTGGGGTGGANNQARKIATYNTGTGAFTVVPNWETTPDNTTTYEVLLPEGVTLGMLQALNPTTAGRKLDVSPGGEAGLDLANVGSPTTVVNLSGLTIKSATDVETDTQDIQNRLPASLSGGKMRSQVEGMDTDSISAAAVSAPAVNKIQNGLALASALVTLQADVTTLVGRITAARAGYWDNLNVGGAVASQADINALNQSASRRLILTGVAQYERPESGSSSFTIELRTYDGDGASVNADSTPTLTATGNVSGSLAGNLSAASNPSTGVYRWTYTVLAAATVEQIRFDASAIISASTFTLPFYSQVVDQVSSTWTATDQAHLTAIFNKLPSKSFLSGTGDSDGSFDAGDLTDILSQAASALVTYDPATGTEAAALDAKLNTLLSGVNLVTWKGTVPGNLDANGFVPSNLAAVNGNAGRATTLANWLDANLLTAVKSSTDKFETTVVLDGSVWKFTANALEDAPTGGASLTLQQIVDGVWDEPISGHLGAGTTGAKLNSASAAGDPLANEVPGTYPIGTAGYVLGTLVTTTFSTPVPAADDCIETQQFDVGEKKRIFAMIGAGVGNLTIQGTPKVSLLNRSGQPVHGISNVNVTGSDAGALSSVRAWYDLDTATPPSGGAIAPGKYTLCFSMTVLKSGGGTETRVIKQPIKVDPLA